MHQLLLTAAALSPGSGVLDSWELAGVHAPHDIALTAAPVGATVGGSRSLAVYVAEAARGGQGSRLHKLIVHHPSASLLLLSSSRKAVPPIGRHAVGVECHVQWTKH
jgi:hypothetical protein